MDIREFTHETAQQSKWKGQYLILRGVYEITYWNLVRLMKIVCSSNKSLFNLFQ